MTNFVFYFIMVFGLVVTSFLSCKFAVDRNWGMVFLIGITYNVIWSFCSYHTKRLGFDAMLYDICVTSFYAIGLIYFGQLQINLTTVSGVVIAIVGLALINFGS